MSDADARKAILDFVVGTHDLFGIPAEDLAHAVFGMSGPQTGGLVARSAELNFQGVQRGYERFGVVNRSFSWSIGLGKNGKIRFANVRSDLLPPFELCTDPKLSPSDPRLVHALVGRDLPGGGGRVEASQIGEKEVTVVRDTGSDRGSIILRLAYAITVDTGKRQWLFEVDADTGDVLGVEESTRRIR
jgi:hypothetical protein